MSDNAGTLLEWMERQYLLSAAAMLRAVSATELVKVPSFWADHSASAWIRPGLSRARFLRSKSGLFFPLGVRFSDRH
ncbi:hypothetical protein [Methylocystis sp.]|uniref:hypothetical protein n=1 Tax=Methylocystis sp. TaxID=1911079 RepID=UPI0025CFA5BE|nr:hypothetical protein [Methylocystis sp.]